MHRRPAFAALAAVSAFARSLPAARWRGRAPKPGALLLSALLCCAPALHAQPAATAASPGKAAAPARQPGADVMAVLQMLDAIGIVRPTEEERNGAEHAGNPAVRAFYVEAMRSYDENELLRRIGLLFEEKVSAEHLRQLAVFAATPNGRAVGRIIQVHKEREALVAALNRLPPEDLAAANRVFTSPAMKSWQQVMASPQVKEIGNAYGQELSCKHARANLPDMYARLLAGGRCPKTP
jgi:hypothetical protein